MQQSNTVLCVQCHCILAFPNSKRLVFHSKYNVVIAPSTIKHNCFNIWKDYHVPLFNIFLTISESPEVTGDANFNKLHCPLKFVCLLKKDTMHSKKQTELFEQTEQLMLSTLRCLRQCNRCQIFAEYMARRGYWQNPVCNRMLYMKLEQYDVSRSSSPFQCQFIFWII